jgi:hypothetical protein
MATPDGYKIYWGLTKNAIDGVHPTNAAYNSPINVTGNVGSFPLPLDFWDSSFTEVYFRVAAYIGALEGVKSQIASMLKFEKHLGTSLRAFSLPLDDGTAYTAKTFASTIDATTVIIYDAVQQKFVSVIASGAPLGPSITKQTGAFVNIRTGHDGTRTWHGQPWKS